ncbi:hypothetical protein MLD38_020004 [Melastoma candidum]|uniref:Uncharacterized protein n=1 Tax=Melastoma candidum TaxID=119954 RepID=A0ACB9QDG3_9MYRT|nr:hypothetical protein MLD38_020004 [Melastoma candidum]
MGKSAEDSEPDHPEEILQHLNTDKQKVFLLGKSGVGKTWMAREICRRAWQRGSYGTLWFAPDNNIYIQRASEDYERRILENVALQLSVYSFNEDCEDDEDHFEAHAREDLDKEEINQRIREKLDAMKSAAEVTTGKDGNPDESSSAIPEPKESPKSNPSVPPAASQEKEKKLKEKKYILVVLDGFAIDEQKKLLEELNKILPFPKYLITGTDGNERTKHTGPEIRQEEENCFTHRMSGLSVQGALKLLKGKVKGHVHASSNFEKLCSEIGQAGSASADERSSLEPGCVNDLLVPSMMIMLAEALNNAQRPTLEGESQEERAGEWTLESAMEEAANIFKSGDVKKLVTLVYEMFTRNGNISDCSWHSRHLFVKPHARHCNELIVHWLLEGYFGDLEQIDMAFEEGHRTLMDLKGRGILKERENSFIYLEGAQVELQDSRHGAFHTTTRLGLADVMTDAEGWAGLGLTTLADGVLKTSHKKKDGISTLIINGLSHLWRRFPGTYLSSMGNLRNVVIINPTFKELPQPLLSLQEIQVLVLRGCSALVNVDGLDKLDKLFVLEISGASSLGTMKDDLFGKMKKIRSINLSGAGIKPVPSSLMKLEELRWLILRDCKLLELDQKNCVNNLEKLEVLDLSGSSNLRRIPDKSLSQLKQLQTLNLSLTKVDRLPFFDDLPKLSRLLLGECPDLARLPTLQKLTALEILDLSGAKALKEVPDDFLENKPNLRVLDLSRSAVTKVPTNVVGLTHLLLRGCTGLTALSLTQKMEKLQVLDLSGASSLGVIEDFEDPRELRDLILSGTKIKTLPKFREGCKLRRLLLKDCVFLTDRPNFADLKSLEVLDLSGCSSLEVKDSFQHMSSLKILNLSGTKLRSLPSDCFPVGLSQLIIRDCVDLKVLPRIESIKAVEKLDLCGSRSLDNMTGETLKHMTDLRVLNLSGVPLKELPPFSHLTMLRELSLAGCSFSVEKLEKLTGLRLLDLTKTETVSLPSLKSFPYLRKLFLRNCSKLKELVDLKVAKNLEVLDIAGTIFGIPQDIASLTGLRELHLQEIKQEDWSMIKLVPEYLTWQKCEPSSTPLGDMTSLVICGIAFFNRLKDNASIWDSHFKRFHFSVWIPKAEAKRRSHEDVRLTSLPERNTGYLKDVISVGRIPPGGNYSRYLEIHGWLFPEPKPEKPSQMKDFVPEGIRHEVPSNVPTQAEPEYNHVEALRDALLRAEHISLIDDSSIQHMSQIGGENLEAMESLWLENCTEITRIINRTEDASLGKKLSSLYLWNLSSLTSMYNNDLAPEHFPHLKTLHIECCPLPKISDPSWLPENLECLHVKFCMDLTIIFDCSSESAEFKLRKLQKLRKLRKLHLIGLPKLTRIGISMPYLKELNLRGCPGVEDLGEVLGQAEYLEILHISDAVVMNRISTGQDFTSFRNLLDLRIDSCPQLEYIFSSPPEKLKSIEIKHCGKLATLFNSGSAPVSLPSLTSLVLWNLPMLENIGAELPRELPFTRCGCPKLVNIT